MGILNEAVKELELLDDTSFDLTDEEALDRLDKFLNDEEEVDDRFEMIIDADAETEEDLKDSYINDLLLYCPVCHQIHFATEEEITADEENPDIVNVGEECPHCKQIDGFEIKGKIAEYKPTEETEEETEVETETKEETEVDEDDFIDEQFSRFVNGDYSRSVSDYNKKGKINESTSEDTPTALNESFDTWKALEDKQKNNKLKESISIKAKEKRNALCEKFGVKNFKELKERFNGKGTKEEQENFVKVLESFGFKNVKFGKSLTEDNEKPLTKSPYKNIIGKHFNYTFDFDFLDIVADIIDRINFDEYKEAEDKFDFVYEELDSSLIDTDDQWKVLQWYVAEPADLDSSSWTETLDNFTNELVEICDKIVADSKEEVEESLTESFNKALQETWAGDDKIADLVERAESMYIDGNYGSMEDCVTQALDDGLIYSVDIWDLAEHYGVIDDSELIDRFYKALWNDVYNEVYSNHLAEDEEEEEEEDEVEESLKEDLYDELDSLDIDEVLDWISDHKELYSDFKHYFNYRYNTRTGEHKNLPSIDEIVEWLEDHETAFEDFKLYFFEEEDDEEEDDEVEESLKERLTPKNEGYSYLGSEDKNIEAYSNYYNAKKRAEELGLKEAEYGDVYGKDMAYCFWNKSGNRNDDEEVICYYFFGKDGKPKHEVTESELERIADAYGLSSSDIDDAEEALDESCKNESVSERDDIDADADDKKEKAKAEDEKAIDDADADRDDKLDESENVSAYTYARTGDIVEIDGKKYQIDWRDHKIGYSDIIDLIDLETKEPITISKEDFIAKAKLVESKDNDCLEELDESIFDKLVNKYCNRVYENIDSYKTTSGSIENNQIVLEGLITFKSGKTSPTKFVFESVKDEKGIRLVGLNETFSKGKKAFKLKGNVENKQFIAESLTYNYRTKVNEETKTIYGRVVNNKK